MALSATTYRFKITLSDVDRGVYEALDLRLARQPSETMRWLLSRTIAYCLSYEEGIAFSKEGLASAEEAPVSIRDATGVLLAWIDVGAPAAERLHKASKAARRVSIFTAEPLAHLRREAASQKIHKVDAIEVFVLEPAFLDALDAKLDRNATFELVRSDGHLYVTVAGGKQLEGTLVETRLVAEG